MSGSALLHWVSDTAGRSGTFRISRDANRSQQQAVEEETVSNASLWHCTTMCFALLKTKLVARVDETQHVVSNLFMTYWHYCTSTGCSMDGPPMKELSTRNGATYALFFFNAIGQS